MVCLEKQTFGLPLYVSHLSSFFLLVFMRFKPYSVGFSSLNIVSYEMPIISARILAFSQYVTGQTFVRLRFY